MNNSTINGFIDKHYGEKTPSISVGGIGCFANSLPIDIIFLENKKARKVLKKSSPNSLSYMNICFERKQQFQDSDVLTWSLDDIEIKVTVLSSTQLMVKGMRIFAYCCAINEDC